MSPKSVPPPNHTQTPNAFYDEMLVEIDTLSELKVTLAIIRQTFGWHKSEDKLSLSQLERLTGLSRQSVAEGVQLALKRGYVGRRKDGQGYVYGLRVASQDTRPPDDSTSQDTRPVASQDTRHTKERSKESVEANASSGIKDTAVVEPVVGLEKFVVDRLYERMGEEGYALDNSDFGYHLGRAQKMLEKMEPTDDEISALPAACVEHYVLKQWTDSMAGLRYMRQQKARPELLAAKRNANAEAFTGPAPWEPKNPHSPKPPMDPEKLAKEKARREEVARMLASAV